MAGDVSAIPKGRMLTLSEAAEYLEVNPDTLRQAAGRGTLRARKPGRDWIVSPAEVERYQRYHHVPGRGRRGPTLVGAERGLTTS